MITRFVSADTNLFHHSVVAKRMLQYCSLDDVDKNISRTRKPPLHIGLDTQDYAHCPFYRPQLVR